MIKKEAYFPIAIFALTALFAVVLVMVYLSNGKSKKWVYRKMKIGGLLLTLTSATACEPFVTTCYDIPSPPNSFYMNNIGPDGIELLLDNGNVLEGTIEERKGEKFSFSIQDSTAKIFQKDQINPLDGIFDNYSETFNIKVDQTLKAGIYYLNLFDVEKNYQVSANPRQVYRLLLKRY